MTDNNNIKAVEALGVDYIGFIFYPKSPRCCNAVPNVDIPPEKRVGVFVNASLSKILEKAEQYHLGNIQLHGTESPERCKQLRNKGFGVIKAFSIADTEDLEKVKAYRGTCDYFLFDTKTPNYGGAGTTFDWEILKSYKDTTPFLLSGGISIDTLPLLELFNHPYWAGVDINSKFETKPGIKNVGLIEEFIKRVTTQQGLK